MKLKRRGTCRAYAYAQYACSTQWKVVFEEMESTGNISLTHTVHFEIVDWGQYHFAWVDLKCEPNIWLDVRTLRYVTLNVRLPGQPNQTISSSSSSNTRSFSEYLHLCELLRHAEMRLAGQWFPFTVPFQPQPSHHADMDRNQMHSDKMTST